MDFHQSPLTTSSATSPQPTSEPGLSQPVPGSADPPAIRVKQPNSGEPATGELPESAVPDEPPIRVMALHALLYCDRLFYLEEVEEIRVADAAVYAGRRLHDDVVSLDDETPEHRSVEVSSETWGLFGKIDAVRRRDGVWVAYEHKRGRCRRGDDNRPQPWPSDRIQAIAYAVLLEEEIGEPVPEARIRYHADNVTALVEIDDDAVCELKTAVARARELRRSTQRPPVHPNENVCIRCSLAPVCLPEEERLAQSKSGNDTPNRKEPSEAARPFFPSRRERQTLHVVSPKSYISRSGATIVVKSEEDAQSVPIQDLDAVVVHGFGQVTTQAIHLCARNGVSVQWLTAGGLFAAGITSSTGRVQQRIRQYQALVDEGVRLRLSRRLVHAKVETQLRYVLRSTRGDDASRRACDQPIARMREALRKVERAPSADVLRGLEGIAAKAYFAALKHAMVAQVPEGLRFTGRTKHPPRDRFNCLLGFGYALIQSLVHRSIVAVGLEPSFGFYHQPRTAAPPLVLDLMELFRTPLWDMPLVGSLNRGQWDAEADFEVRPGHVWLTEAGRKKTLQLFEQRLQESYKHPYTGQALSYARMVELEARLLEKEWTGCPDVFAKLRLR
jgi:CRISP-associated protein Cas1